ncbi:MAG: cupin domain-containing protein [Pseudomonadota bacterium]
MSLPHKSAKTNLEEREELAASFVLGTLDAHERARVEALLAHDQELAALVNAWDERLTPLASGIEPAPLPKGLFASIEAAIDQLGDGPAGTTTVRSGEGVWEAVAPGVERKLLAIEPRSKRRSLLFRMAPGSTYKPHAHPQHEECLMLEGDLRFGDLELRAGDYHLVPAGMPHPTAFSRSGCLLYISTGD